MLLNNLAEFQKTANRPFKAYPEPLIVSGLE